MHSHLWQWQVALAKPMSHPLCYPAQGGPAKFTCVPSNGETAKPAVLSGSRRTFWQWQVALAKPMSHPLCYGVRA